MKRFRSSRKAGIASFDLSEFEMTRKVPVKFSNIKFSGSRIVFLRTDGRVDGRNDFIRHDANLTVPLKNWSLK